MLQNWPWPERPAQRIYLDFLGPVEGKMFIVIVDAFSKWVYVKSVKNITSEWTIRILKEYFSFWGIPEKIVTDNGPSLCSELMEQFKKKMGLNILKLHHIIHQQIELLKTLLRHLKSF